MAMMMANRGGYSGRGRSPAMGMKRPRANFGKILDQWRKAGQDWKPSGAMKKPMSRGERVKAAQQKSGAQVKEAFSRAKPASKKTAAEISAGRMSSPIGKMGNTGQVPATTTTRAMTETSLIPKGMKLSVSPRTQSLMNKYTPGLRGAGIGLGAAAAGGGAYYMMKGKGGQQQPGGTAGFYGPPAPAQGAGDLRRFEGGRMSGKAAVAKAPMKSGIGGAGEPIKRTATRKRRRGGSMGGTDQGPVNIKKVVVTKNKKKKQSRGRANWKTAGIVGLSALAGAAIGSGLFGGRNTATASINYNRYY